MERKISFQQAINEALAPEMERDSRVIVMGEDVAGGSGTDGKMDAWGGVLGVTKGLWDKFGDRVLDTPITESAFVGAAIGAATTGLRPVVELMFVDFMGVCFDQIFNQAAKFRYMFGGKAVTPLVVRTMYGAGFRAAAQHSQCLYPLFTHIPGLKCVDPIDALRCQGPADPGDPDNDPVIFFEHKLLYSVQGAVPEETYTIPFGEANVVREGGDVTIVTLGRMVHTSLDAAAQLAAERRRVRGHRSAHDLARWTRTPCWRASRRPDGWSWSTRRTRAARSPPTSRRWSRRRRSASLKAPIQMVTAPHTPVPFSSALEDCYIPDAQRVANAVKTVTGWTR